MRKMEDHLPYTLFSIADSGAVTFAQLGIAMGRSMQELHNEVSDNPKAPKFFTSVIQSVTNEKGTAFVANVLTELKKAILDTKRSYYDSATFKYVVLETDTVEEEDLTSRKKAFLGVLRDLSLAANSKNESFVKRVMDDLK